MRLFHGRFHRRRVANTAAVEKLLTRDCSQAATLQKIAFMAFFDLQTVLSTAFQQLSILIRFRSNSRQPS